MVPGCPTWSILPHIGPEIAIAVSPRVLLLTVRPGDAPDASTLVGAENICRDEIGEAE